MRTLKNTILLVLAFIVTVAVGAKAGETAKSNPFLGTLSAATSAELPGKAADLVSQATAKERLQTTIDVVNAAIPLNPAAARAIVGSIAHSSPEMAATAAATAAALLPDQAATIASVAAAAAPGQAAKIVEAVCLVAPQNYKEIAEAVAEIVPGSAKEILTAVATAVPSLKNSINQILIADNGSVASVNDVLAQATPDSGKGSGLGSLGMDSQPNLSHGSSGTPIVLGGTPLSVSAGGGSTVPPSGRSELNGGPPP
jgi:hypothetical protein